MDIYLTTSQDISQEVKTWLKMDRNFEGRIEKVCASTEACKPDSVTPALSGEMGQNSSNLVREACGRPA